jgi:transcriptional regulator with XRE-family HTH domain
VPRANLTSGLGAGSERAPTTVGHATRPVLGNEIERLDNGAEGSYNLGERLRAVRLAQRLTLQEVARRASLSRAFLSQVEHNQVSPSVASVSRIAHALDLSLSGLFAPRSNLEGLVRRDKRVKVEYSGYKDELVSPSLSGHLLVLLSEFEPGADSGEELYAHDADEECIYVLQGSLDVTVEANTYSLGVGDAFTFSSRRSHGWRNPGRKRTVALWVITPPRY